MVTKLEKLTGFMNEKPDGTYDVTKPTTEQLAAVLPFVFDTTVRWARQHGHCGVVNAALYNLIYPGKTVNGSAQPVVFRASDGRDCYGYDKDGFNTEGFDANRRDRDGFNSRGYDRDGYNREGRDSYGYDREGFNAEGRDRHGLTREDAAAELVTSWSPAYLAAVAARLKDKLAAALQTPAAADTAAAEDATTLVNA